LISDAKSGANFSLKAYCNIVKRVEVVILLPFSGLSAYLLLSSAFDIEKPK
jgi:hypothetical protein